MMAHQLIHHYKNVSNSPAALAFLDLAHAFDYISQEFILETLQAMNFPNNFIKAVSTLMTLQEGRVMVNGDLSPPFPVDNGGKQGDPLFPFIYIIANEAMMAILESHPDFKGIKLPDSDQSFLSQSYVDDTMIGLGSENDALILDRDIIPLFEAATGNQIKIAKSFLLLFN